MNRGHVDEFYTAYLESSLPDGLRQEVEAHLRECPQCAEELADLCRVVEFMHELPAVTPPQDFAVVVRAGLPEPRRRLRLSPMSLWAGGAVAACLVVGVMILRFSGPPPGTFTANRQPDAVVARAQKKCNANVPTTRAVPLDDTAKLVQAPQAGGKIGSDTLATDERTSGTEPKMSLRERIVGLTSGLRRDSDAASEPTQVASVPKGITPSAPAAERGPVSEQDASARADGSTDNYYSGANAPKPAANTAAPSAPAQSLMSQSAPAVAERGRSAMTKSAGEVSFDMAASAADAGTTTLSVDAVTLPGDQPGQVRLSIETSVTEGIKLVNVTAGGISEAFSFAKGKWTGPLEAPISRDGLAMKITVRMNTGAKLDERYLVIPGAGTRQAKSSVQVRELPIVEMLKPLATDAGTYILCPATFGDKRSSMSVSKLRPLDVVTNLAAEQGYRASLRDQMVVITGP